MEIVETAAARRDVMEVMHYIALDSARAAEAWLEGLYKRYDLLAQMPNSGRERPDFGADLRSIPFGNYLIFYRVMESHIEIVRVWHGAQNPDRFDEDGA